MSVIVINGKRTTVFGKNIRVENDSIYVDGLLVESGLQGIVKIQFEGDLASLESHNTEVFGNIAGNVDSHNLKCNDIGGSVKSHNVSCKSIMGNVTAKNVSK